MTLALDDNDLAVTSVEIFDRGSSSLEFDDFSNENGKSSYGKSGKNNEEMGNLLSTVNLTLF